MLASKITQFFRTTPVFHTFFRIGLNPSFSKGSNVWIRKCSSGQYDQFKLPLQSTRDLINFHLPVLKIKTHHNCDFCLKSFESLSDQDVDNQFDEVLNALKDNKIAFVRSRLLCPRFRRLYHDRFGDFFVTSCFTGSIEIAQMIYSNTNNKISQLDYEYALINAVDKNHTSVVAWLETLPQICDPNVRKSLVERALFFEENEKLKEYLEMKQDFHYLNLIERTLKQKE